MRACGSYTLSASSANLFAAAGCVCVRESFVCVCVHAILTNRQHADFRLGSASSPVTSESALFRIDVFRPVCGHCHCFPLAMYQGRQLGLRFQGN